MRRLTPLLILSALASCTYAPPGPAVADTRSQARLAKMLAGKVPGAPQSCLPRSRSNDMTVIDDNTIAFRDGTNRVWVTHPRGGCNLLASGGYTLVLRNFGGMGLCQGDIGSVVDLRSHSTVGSCSMGEFVPYTTPRR